MADKGDVTCTYDSDGELAASGGTTFASVSRNACTRLPVRVAGSGGTVLLRYDCFGRRLGKQGENGLETTVYRNGLARPTPDSTETAIAPSSQSSGLLQLHPLSQRVNGLEKSFVFTPAGQTLAVFQTGQNGQSGHSRLGRDHLRSVRVEFSGAKAICAVYGTYGEALLSGGVLGRGFAGWEMDLETGLCNAYARLYSPRLRGFLGVDPMPESASPYAYCVGDPFNRIDPDGSVSEVVISSIVSSIVLVASIVISIFTAGAAAPAAVGADIAAGGNAAAAAAVGAAEGEAVAAVAGAQAAQAARTAAATIARLIPYRGKDFALFGLGLGAASSALGNGIGLASQAACGEHVTAWQAVKGMVLEPAMAGFAGAIAGSVAWPLLLSTGVSAIPRFVLAASGAMVASLLSGVADSAVDGKLARRDTWVSIGISMAISVLEAIALTPALGRVRPSYFYEGIRPEDFLGFMDASDFNYRKTPVGQAIRLRDFFARPELLRVQHLRDYGEYDLYTSRKQTTWRTFSAAQNPANLYGVRRCKYRDW